VSRIVQVANFVTPTSGGLRTALQQLSLGYRDAGPRGRAGAARTARRGRRDGLGLAGGVCVHRRCPAAATACSPIGSVCSAPWRPTPPTGSRCTTARRCATSAPGPDAPASPRSSSATSGSTVCCGSGCPRGCRSTPRRTARTPRWAGAFDDRRLHHVVGGGRVPSARRRRARGAARRSTSTASGPTAAPGRGWPASGSCCSSPRRGCRARSGRSSRSRRCASWCAAATGCVSWSPATARCGARWSSAHRDCPSSSRARARAATRWRGCCRPPTSCWPPGRWRPSGSRPWRRWRAAPGGVQRALRTARRARCCRPLVPQLGVLRGRSGGGARGRRRAGAAAHGEAARGGLPVVAHRRRFLAVHGLAPARVQAAAVPA
jgi:hypothetical protein